MKKEGLQISFAWLFSIIVGIFILVITIYAVTKTVSNSESVGTAQTGKEIAILLNPLETGFQSATSTLLKIPLETRINNDCAEDGDFGFQGISLEQKSFNRWSETGVETKFQNKYIFSDKSVEGKDFYLFSKPFNFPFKVADVIYLTSSVKSYCFVNSSAEIREEILGLQQANLFITDCPETSINICFQGNTLNGKRCDIEVNENLKSVEKKGETVYYETDSLMYAAIFSDKDIYECQVKRLMQKTSELSLIYDDKTTLISKQGCLAEVNVLALSDSAKSYTDSKDLSFISVTADGIEEENNNAECKLW